MSRPTRAFEPRAVVPFRLEAIDGPSAGTTCNGDGSEALTIGKSSRNAFVLRDPTVSREHAVIEVTGERYRLRDLGSTNGTKRAGHRISRDGVDLEDGDELVLGHTVLRFSLARPAPKVELPDRPTDADKTMVDVAPPLDADQRSDEPPVAPVDPGPRHSVPPKPSDGPRQVLDTVGPFEVTAILDPNETVVLARDSRKDAMVTLFRVPAADIGFFARRALRKACRNVSGLEHDNLLAPLDVEPVGKELCLVYPAMQGVTLRMLLRECAREIPMELAVYAARELCAGLAHVHGAVGSERAVGIADTRVIVDGAGRVALLYLPEQIPNDERFAAPEAGAHGEADARASIFSTGVVLYELLAREAIDAAQRTTLPNIKTRRIRVPGTLAAATMRALELRPEERFADPSSFADALAESLEALAPGYAAEAAGAWVTGRFPEQAAGGSPG